MTILEASDQVRWDHSGPEAKPKLPPAASAELMAFVVEHRQAVLDKSRDRYMRAPPDDAFLPFFKTPTDPLELARVLSFAGNQSRAVAIWLDQRKKSLAENCCDLIAWQFAYQRDPIRYILELD